MTRKENTIYVRPTTDRSPYAYKAFVKAQGEGAVVGGVTREDAIRAAGNVLWAIATFGPYGWQQMRPIDRLPGLPEKFDYPVVDEKAL